MDPYQVPQIVEPDLDSNFLTLWKYCRKIFLKKFDLKKSAGKKKPTKFKKNLQNFPYTTIVFVLKMLSANYVCCIKIWKQTIWTVSSLIWIHNVSNIDLKSTLADERADDKSCEW